VTDCRHCNQPMTPGGTAIACGPYGTSHDIKLPDHCDNPVCQQQRDEAAVAWAIKKGLIKRS
jgi:hypothetical protein